MTRMSRALPWNVFREFGYSPVCMPKSDWHCHALFHVKHPHRSDGMRAARIVRVSPEMRTCVSAIRSGAALG
jgi:hypothetical protein